MTRLPFYQIESSRGAVGNFVDERTDFLLADVATTRKENGRV